MNTGAPEGLLVPAPPVTPVMLLYVTIVYGEMKHFNTLLYIEFEKSTGMQ